MKDNIQHPFEKMRKIIDEVERYKHLIYLLLEGLIFDLEFDEAQTVEDIQGHLNMNDTFAYACADSTIIPIGREHEVVEIYKKFGHDGVIAWASMVEGCKPIGPRRTRQFKAAAKWLTKKKKEN